MSVKELNTYLKARTAVMSSQILDREGIESLLLQSLEEICEHYQFNEILEISAEPSVRIKAFERTLIYQMMNDLTVLMRPLAGPARDILVHWTRKYELFNLKALIRGKLQGLSYDALRDSLYNLPDIISLPHEELLRTENIAELLRQLEGGQYADIARQARKVYEEKNEPFSLDATIDQRYFTGLLKRARLIPAEERSPLMTLIGTVIDQQNLLWLLRYRFNYELSPSETYYLLIHAGHHLPRQLLAELVNLETPQQVIAALPEEYQAALSETDTPMQIELAVLELTTTQALKSLKYSPSAITTSLAYLILREITFTRLFSIIQSKVLGLEITLVRTVLGFEKTAVESAHV